jgi:hypothetical protein
MLCGCIPDVVIVYEDKYSDHVVTQSKYPIAMLDERLETQTNQSCGVRVSSTTRKYIVNSLKRPIRPSRTILRNTRGYDVTM